MFLGVAEIFSKCGDIVLVRVLRPGNPIPADIKPFANKHPEMTAKVKRGKNHVAYITIPRGF